MIEREEKDSEEEMKRSNSNLLSVMKNNSAPTVPTKKKNFRMSFRKDSPKDDRDKEEKKRLREEVRVQLSSKPLTKGPTVATEELTILSGWLKMRNSMKIWVNRYCVLRPGKLIYFRDEKDVARDRCSGILRLADCKVKERTPSKDGYSFKIFHLLHYPIYHKYGLKGETIKLAMIPVSWSQCILRATNASERKQWVEGINEQIIHANEHDRSLPPEMKDFEPAQNLSEEEEEEEAEDIEEHDRIFSSPEPEQHEDTPEKDKIETDARVPNPKELADELFFVKHENLHRSLMEGMNTQHDSSIKKLQTKTLKQMEQWKKELDMRLMGMEKRMNQSLANKDTKVSRTVQLKYWQLIVIIIVAILIGRFSFGW